MVFCSKCGNELHKDAFFCPHCGFRTQAGVEAGVASASDEIRETLSKIGNEMEKAFTLAAKEVQKAYKTARENLRTREVICANCGDTNSSDDKYCSKCGKELAQAKRV